MTTPDPERANEINAIAAVLDAFPDIGPRKGRRIAIHPKLTQAFAEELHDKGLRMHPELAALFPIPGKSRGAMPYTNLPDWVDRDTYLEFLAEHPDRAVGVTTADAPTLAQMQTALQAIFPDRAAELAAMTPAELAAVNAEYAAKVPKALTKLAQIAERNHKVAQDALRKANRGTP